MKSIRISRWGGLGSQGTWGVKWTLLQNDFQINLHKKTFYLLILENTQTSHNNKLIRNIINSMLGYMYLLFYHTLFSYIRNLIPLSLNGFGHWNFDFRISEIIFQYQKLSCDIGKY